MKLFDSIKRKALAAAVLLGVAAPSFAEGTSSTVDLSAATTALQDMSSSVTSWIGTAAPYVVAVLGAALVITVVFVAYKWIRRGTNRA